MDGQTRTTPLGVVLVTANSQQESEAIAQALVQAKMAACVTVTPVRSCYIWQEVFYNQEQWQLVIKTDLTLFPVLEAKIRELHSDQVPEIIAIPIVDGSESYLNWISQQVQKTSFQ